MRLPRRLKTIAMAVGIACSFLMVWKYWNFSEIPSEDDYEIKISEEELKQLRQGRDSELDSELEKMIKQKLQNEHGQLQEIDLPEVAQPTESPKLKLWRSPLFEKILGTNVYFRSPTFDDKDKSQEVVRLLFVSSNKDHPVLYCHIMLSHDPILSLRLVTQARLKTAVMEDNGVTQGEVLCPWTSAQGPVVVTLSTSNTNFTNYWHNIEYYVFRPPTELRYSVCLSAQSLSSNDLEDIMHWFDIQKLMGVKKVFLYGVPNLSPAELDLLDEYKDSGFLRITHWQLPIQSQDNGRYLANLDCLYKNMDASTFLLYLDMGQYLVPAKYKTLLEMMQFIDDHIPKAVAYQFQVNCCKKQLEKIIFNGLLLDIHETFKENENSNSLDNKNLVQSLSNVFVRPQIVKNLLEIFNYKENNVDMEIIGSGIGRMFQYGSDICS